MIYEVWFNLYGPGDCDLGLADAVKELISKDCELSGVVPSSPEEAVSTIMEMILYEGDTGAGPVKLASKKSEIIELMTAVLSHIEIDQADMVVEFGLAKGHPAYPVF